MFTIFVGRFNRVIVSDCRLQINICKRLITRDPKCIGDARKQDEKAGDSAELPSWRAMCKEFHFAYDPEMDPEMAKDFALTIDFSNACRLVHGVM